MPAAPTHPAADPARRESATPAAAASAVRTARSARENFPVLSWFLPRERREDFAAVYAFCRGADDIADAGGDPESRAAALAELGHWRELLDRCRAPDAPPTDHPVFDALGPVIRRRNLPVGLFEDLLTAFERDQVKTRYDTWEELVEYSRYSANPVGRLVLAIAGQLPGEGPPRAGERDLEPGRCAVLAESDATCTALQLANFWQDVRRDLFELDRIYLPLRETGLTETQLRNWAATPRLEDRFREAITPLVDRTRDLMLSARPLPGRLSGWARPVVSLFQRGGLRILEKIEQDGFSTLWRRPRLSRIDRISLIMAEAINAPPRSRP